MEDWDWLFSGEGELDAGVLVGATAAGIEEADQRHAGSVPGPTGKKRSGAPTSTKACDACYARKVRCEIDPNNPACANCLRADVACTFARESKKRGPKARSSQSNKENATAIPIPQEPQTLISKFFNTVYPSLPILLPRLLYDPALVDPPHQSLLIDAMSALASTSYEDAEPFYARATEASLLLTEPTVASIAALVMLHVHAALYQRGLAAYSHLAAAIQMCKEHQLHNQNAWPRMTWLEREWRKRVFWACYVKDRFSCFDARMEPMLRDNECRVSFPASEQEWLTGFPASLEIDADTEAGEIALMTSTTALDMSRVADASLSTCLLVAWKLFGQVLVHRLSAKPTSEDFVALDASLRCFHLSLPPGLNTVSLNDQFTINLAPNDSALPYPVFTLHLLLHFTAVNLHLPHMMSAYKLNPTEARKNPHLHLCRAHAKHLARVLFILAQRNPALVALPRALVKLAIVDSCIVHRLVAHMEPALAAACRGDVLVILRVFRENWRGGEQWTRAFERLVYSEDDSKVKRMGLAELGRIKGELLEFKEAAPENPYGEMFQSTLEDMMETLTLE
ncbi:fungal-specific transcription factor domain-containing protein [Chytriomyces sp. MP71]|nr:fungal-specific transcription factor domain-containing protein [Chytriomyces sp. MP71]